MKTITRTSDRTARVEILHQLGHEFSGSLSAEIDASAIEQTDDSRRLAKIYTHSDLPGVEVIVEWADEA